MADIKLFVCCHQPVEIPKHPLLIPIQVGAALTETHFPGFLYDDTGENISEKNRFYCELTAQYWAWKNIYADYYGFFHYRRYLYPDQGARRPYRIELKPSPDVLDRLGYAQFEALIPEYDLILPKGENMYLPVRKHYAAAPFHHWEDLDRIERIIWEQTPEYSAAMDKYLAESICYFGNIFIMKRQVFTDYCRWLFSILEEFDRKTDTGAYDAQERRVDGYLAERLLGVYYTRRKSELNTLELPRVYFDADYKKRMLYYILPPGSFRRSLVKRLSGKYR